LASVPLGIPVVNHEVEKETGLDFLKDLDKQTEAQLEAKRSQMW